MRRMFRSLARLGQLLGLVVAMGFAQSVPLAADGAVDRVVAAHYPPLMIKGSAERPGVAIEILQAAADRLDRSITVEFLPFQRAMFQVQQRSDTMMAALFRSPEREAEYQWIVQIQKAELRFITKGVPVNDLDVARQLKSIAVESGSSTQRFLLDREFTNVYSTIGPDASADMLAFGRVDAWFLTQFLGEEVWLQHGLGQSVIFGDPVHEVPVYLVAGPGFSPDLAKKYHDAIAAMTASGELAQIRDRYNRSNGGY